MRGSMGSRGRFCRAGGIPVDPKMGIPGADERTTISNEDRSMIEVRSGLGCSLDAV